MILTVVLSIALLVVLILLVVWRRHLTILMTLGSLLAGILLLIWMQSMGLLPGTQGPLSQTRPQTLEDARR